MSRTLELESLLNASCTCNTQPRYRAVHALLHETVAKRIATLETDLDEARADLDAVEDLSVVGVVKDKLCTTDIDEVLGHIAGGGMHFVQAFREWLESYHDEGKLADLLGTKLLEKLREEYMGDDTDTADTAADTEPECPIHGALARRRAKAWHTLLLSHKWRQPRSGLADAYLDALAAGKTWEDLPFGERYGGKVVTRRAALEVRDAVDKAWEEARS